MEGLLLQYTEIIQYLDNISSLGSKLDLCRIEELLDKLGCPHEKLNYIHVAGTNGKGSSCAMLQSILTEAGYRTGMYTSPHLEKYNERYQINGQPITDEDFAAGITLIATLCTELVREGKDHPTVYEILTALAFHYFYSNKVDIVVLEVGLGGRFDATNVIKKPLLSLITSIGMDHMDFLGYSIEEIAFEKGGIIKKDCPVVLYSQGEIVYNKIKSICDERNAELTYTNQNEIQVIAQDLNHTLFSLKNEYISFPKVDLPLLGCYQIQNCATVLLACKVLQEQGINLTQTSILEGIRKTHWEGRMELCHENPLVLLDGAHNIDGITMLADSLKLYFPNKKITLLLGVLGDKEYEKMAEILLPCVHYIVLTEPLNDRKLAVDSLEETISYCNKPIFKNPDIQEAYKISLEITEKDQVIVCCGSLYMIGEIRSHIAFNRRLYL